MRQGFILDEGDNAGWRQARWAPGAPVKSFWLGLKVDKSSLIPIVTLRCDRCGYLESYAAEITGI
jgi:hypothetical protein